MGEIGWGGAFGYALKYIVYTILWLIIGGIFIVAGSMMIGLSFTSYTSAPMNLNYIISNVGKFITGIILIIIGWIIMFLGSMASYFKIMSKLIRESTR